MRLNKKSILLSFYFCSALALLLQISPSQAMLVGIRSGGNLVTVDPSANPAIVDISAGMDLVDSFHNDVSSITFDPTTNKLYAVSVGFHWDGGNGGWGDLPKLYSIDWATLVVEEIGFVHFPTGGLTIQRCEGLAFNTIDNKLYATVSTNWDSWDSERLVEINPLNGEAIQLNFLQGPIDGDGLEFGGENLYLYDWGGMGVTYLYNVNYNTSPGDYTNTGVDLSGMCVWTAYEEADERVYFIKQSDTAQDLWSFDATNPGDYQYETYIGARNSLISLTAIKTLYYVDIQPGECPNILFRQSNDIIRVAIMGNWRFDVSNIDQSSITITCSYFNESKVSPVNQYVLDAGGLFAGRPEDCGTPGSDGYSDLILEFNTQDLLDEGLDGATEGENVKMTISGLLLDGSPLNGDDYLRVQETANENQNGNGGICFINTLISGL